MYIAPKFPFWAAPPSKRGSARRAEWVNTAEPKFHLRPTVAKSPSSLRNFCSPSYFPALSLLLCLYLVPHPRTYFSSRTFFNCPFCSALSLPKSCWACPLQIPPKSYFTTSLSLFLPYFPVLWIFYWLVDFTCIVSKMRFSTLLFYLDFSENFIYILKTCFFFIDLVLVNPVRVRFCFEFDASAASICIFVLI